jgi:hypothetical protein
MHMVSGKKGGPQVANFHRPCSCLIAPLKCCCHQRIDITDASKTHVGSVVESCWFFIPSFNVLGADRRAHLTIQPPTCCCGLCVDYCADGCCNRRIPLYVFRAEDSHKSRGNEVGKIVKVWAGLGKEFFGIHKFEVTFPDDATVETKAQLIGAMFLLNELFFRTDNKTEELVE